MTNLDSADPPSDDRSSAIVSAGRTDRVRSVDPDPDIDGSALTETGTAVVPSAADLAATLSPADEWPHAGALHEEWTWSFWAPDASIGGFVAYRLVGAASAWYCWALARAGEPLLHVTEFDIPRRSDPLLAKAQAMWAEFTCDAPFEQWTVGNETYAVALDDPSEALARGYGTAVPIASDLEWYATGPAVPIPGSDVTGYEQPGVVHGAVELLAGPLDLTELPASRTHRWSTAPLPTLPLPTVLAHVGLRAPFRLPDDSILDLVLTTTGWRRRAGT